MGVTLIENATVWTGVPGTDGIIESDALAFDETGVIGLGADARRAPASVRIDGDGGFVCSGFRDGHAHPLTAATQSLFAPVGDEASLTGLLEAVGTWASAHPEEEWVRGEGFDPSLAPAGVFRAEWLDRVVPDRPVALRASDYHTVWVNSEALRRVGYAAGTPDPADGEIVRDPDGGPVGTLREWGAWRPVYDLLPRVAEPRRVEALHHAAQRLAEAGLVWVQDAWTEPDDVDVWLAAASSPDLRVRADLALWCDPHSWRDQLDHFVASRDRVAAAGQGRVSAATVKFFADGVIESGTGALLEPYHDCPHSRGLPNWDPDELARAVTATAELGFLPHIHAIGDAAVRTALDAIEAAQAQVGRTLSRAVVAHAQLIDPADLPRFAALDVIANFEPYWAHWDSCQMVLTHPRLGDERTARQYLIRSVLDSGAVVSFGSDWPVTTHRPLDGIQVAVTRQADDAQEPWIPDERITVDDALLAYTRAVAHQAGDARGGLLQPGMRSDVTLLERDPRQVDPRGIAGIAVRGTWRDGVRTWGG